MIVRISNEGQYEVSDEDIAGSNELDNEAVASCEASDEQAFHEVFGRLLDYVRTQGHPGPRRRALRRRTSSSRPPTSPSTEARREFQGEGLIPG